MSRIRRDTSLGRITRITKSLGVGIIAATGALGFYLSQALPGHSSTTQGTSSPASNISPTGSSTSGNVSASGQLAPPSSPPVQSQQLAPVVTGSS